MDASSLRLNGKAWTTKGGGIAIWVPSPSLLVLSMWGVGEVGFVAPILAEYARLTSASSFDLFADVQQLTSYDSRLRTELTTRFFADRKRIANFPLLFSSRLVAMGASVANLALGGIMTATSNRGRFIALLDTCLFQRGIVGFSSNVLGAAQPATAEQGEP
jgi:hypothetical protein